MIIKDDPFVPYNLPYRHNIRNYTRFIRDKGNHDENDYFIYLVSTPYKQNHSKTNNDYSFDVAILVKNKKTGEISLKFETFDFKTILEINIFSKINKECDVTLFEETEKKFSKKIKELNIDINDTEKYEVLNLEEVASRFNILDKCEIYKYDKFKNLEFYLFDIDQKQLLIPAIEILKYFYLYDSQGNLKSHFCNDILTPQGIHKSLKNYKRVSNHYDIEISGDYSLSDRYKILFFLSNTKRLSMYSKIFDTYKKTKKIEALIPRKDVSLKVRAFDYEDKNLLLVLNLIGHDSNKSKEFPSDFSYNYTHTKSQAKEKDNGKRDSSKDIKKGEVNNSNLNFDDDYYGNKDLDYDDETKDDFKLNIEKIRSGARINLNGKKIIDKQKEQQGGKTISENLGEAPSTTKKNYGNKDKAVSDTTEEEEKSNKLKITLNDIIVHSKEATDLIYKGQDSFIYPEVINDQGEVIKKGFMFTDKRKKIKRKYLIAKVIYDNKDLYIVELQPKLNGTTKSLLTIILENQNINSIDEYFIKKELSEFIEDRDRSWFRGRLNLNDKHYFTYKHSGTLKGYIKKLTKHIDKYF